MTPAWDPEVLARLGHLQLVARQATESLRHGVHPSLRTASNVEFADYKVYTPGDPIRDVDWKVAARSDRWVVRRHRAETDLGVTLVLDASADLSTGRSGMVKRPPLQGSKFGVALSLVASLAYFLHKRGEPVGLTILGGEDVPWRSLPPQRSSRSLAALFSSLASVVPSGRANLAQGLRDIGLRMNRRQVVILVSDLMEDPAEWGPALRALSRSRTDIRVAHLYDRGEWALDYKDSARFWSPEGGPELPIDPAGVREAFAEVVAEYLDEVRTALSSRRAVHVLVPTDEPLDRAAASILRGIA